MADRVDTVRRGYDAFNDDDIDTALELFHADIVWQTWIVPGPGGGTYRGHDGVRELWSDAKRIFGDFRNVPEEIFDAGDRVVAFVRVEGVGARSGVAVEGRIAHVHTFEEGKIIRVESYQDRDAALRAVAL